MNFKFISYLVYDANDMIGQIGTSDLFYVCSKKLKV